jgi:hypothetical protein
MATTVNNTTINTKLTIIFDANVNTESANDGPASGSGNTESDVNVDNKSYLNIRSHTEIDATVHALQWDATTNTGHIELTSNAENQSISSLPQWATNVVIRCEAQDIWQTNYNTTYNGHSDANADDDSAAVTAATSAADTARNNYLSGHSITY